MLPDDTAPPDTPAEPSAPAPAAAPDGVAPAAQPTTDPGSAPAPTAGVPAATSEPAPEPATTAPQFFEALGPDEQPFQIPLGTRFPWKRGDETGFATVEEIAKSPMFERDYRHKTQELGVRERVLADREAEIERARLEYETRIEAARTNQRRLVEAATQGGEAYAKELRHQEMMENDPEYRERYEQSEEFRIHQRLSEHDAESDKAARTQSTTERVRSYIAEQCAKVPGLDPDAIEEAYGRALRRGHARLHADDLDQIIAKERTRVEGLTQPLRGEVEGLKQQVANLSAQLQASAHNAGVSAAIDRATGATPGRPANGAPPAPRGARKPFNPSTDNESEWLRNWNAESAPA